MLMHLPFHLVENACETLAPCDIAALACCCKGLAGLSTTVHRMHRKWTAAMLEHHLQIRPRFGPSLPVCLPTFPLEIEVRLGSGLTIEHYIDCRGVRHISCWQKGWGVWMTDTERCWTGTIKKTTGLWESMTDYPHVPRRRKEKASLSNT